LAWLVAARSPREPRDGDCSRPYVRSSACRSEPDVT
jgi:hypothetical protein